MVGVVNKNTRGTPMKIVAYHKYNDIDVQFLDEHGYIKKHVLCQAFNKGQVKNPYDRSVYGVGYIGEGNHIIIKNKKVSIVYEVWSEMLARCYLKERQHLHKSYYGIATVCPEWQCFNTFANWYEENRYEVEGRLHLDKDILYPGNKEYAPDKCVLTPQRINMLFTNQNNKSGLPNGIRYATNGRYSAEYNTVYLGTFNTLEDAFNAYAKAKESKIKQVADEYKNIIPQKLYDALYAYKVNIRNDKNYTKSYRI